MTEPGLKPKLSGSRAPSSNHSATVALSHDTDPQVGCVPSVVSKGEDKLFSGLKHENSQLSKVQGNYTMSGQWKIREAILS